jgi:2'-5' RNA ligase
MRVFFAVRLTDEVKSNIGRFIGKLRSYGGKVRWVDEENLHITLLFLGELEEGEIEAVVGASRHALRRVRPFRVSHRGSSAFPSLSRPRVVWTGVGEGREELISLHAAVTGAVRESGVGVTTDTKPYHPHTTIGRVRSSCPPRLVAEVDEAKDLSFGAHGVREVVLFRSTLTPRGSVYDEIAAVDLAG